MARLTLEEIGKIAGVSRATVSRVINNHPNISDDVRAQVQKVIDETGYRPNIAARTLASNSSQILGLVIPSILSNVFTNPYYPRLIQGIGQACNETEYSLTLFIFQSPEEEQLGTKRIIGNALLDGLIVSADNADADMIERLLAGNVPFVQIGRPINHSDKPIHYIETDNYEGAVKATQHLIDLGYQRIAQIATAKNTAGMDRDYGYRNTLETNNLPIDDDLIAYTDFSEEKAYAAMQTLLPHAPDAVFIHSDAMAIGAMRAIDEAGLKIPDDIAVVGFDDLPPALSAKPPLTTLRQPIAETGAAAVQTLIQILEHPNDAPIATKLPVELVIRESCGAKRDT